MRPSRVLLAALARGPGRVRAGAGRARRAVDPRARRADDGDVGGRGGRGARVAARVGADRGRGRDRLRGGAARRAHRAAVRRLRLHGEARAAGRRRAAAGRGGLGADGAARVDRGRVGRAAARGARGARGGRADRLGRLPRPPDGARGVLDLAGRRRLRGRPGVELPRLVGHRGWACSRSGRCSTTRRRSRATTGRSRSTRGRGWARRSPTRRCGGGPGSPRRGRPRWGRSQGPRCGGGCDEGRRDRRGRGRAGDRGPARGGGPRASRVLEAGDAAGGKCGRVSAGGYTWDSGPSLLTMPWVFEALFAETGAPLGEVLELLPVEPVTRYRFADGTGFDLSADLAVSRAALDAWRPGAGDEWARFMRTCERMWRASEPVLTGPAPWPPSRDAQASPGALLDVKPWWTLRQLARAHTRGPAAADGHRALRDLRRRGPAARAGRARGRRVRRARLGRVASARRDVRAGRGAGRAARRAGRRAAARDAGAGGSRSVPARGARAACSVARGTWPASRPTPASCPPTRSWPRSTRRSCAASCSAARCRRASRRSPGSR